MILKGLIQEDFVNYKKPSMFLIFPKCNGFKCGAEFCQNSTLPKEKDIEVSISRIIDLYLNNSISHAIVCGGLEPFDSFEDLKELIAAFREHSSDDIVIYTGYTEEELSTQIDILSKYKNIIIKFGRFIPNQSTHYDEILGVKLISDNQYGKKVS